MAQLPEVTNQAIATWQWTKSSQCQDNMYLRSSKWDSIFQELKIFTTPCQVHNGWHSLLLSLCSKFWIEQHQKTHLIRAIHIVAMTIFRHMTISLKWLRQSSSFWLVYDYSKKEPLFTYLPGDNLCMRALHLWV